MKYAVVTGATKGIGKAISKKMLEEGCFVVANYARDENGAADFSNEMSQFTTNFAIIKQELTSWEAVQSFSEKVLEISSKIDCLVLNAGATDRSCFDEITKDGWERVINTNLNAPFYLVQRLSPHITESTGGIIFIGSNMGEYPHATSLSYSVTKAAIHHMAKSLVKVFSPEGITVNAIAPGFVETPWQYDKSDAVRKSIESKIALHRFASPDEIAELCWHIFNNRYINGSVVDISGGYCYK